MTEQTTPPAGVPRFLTVLEVATALRLSRQTVYRMIALGEIDVVRTGIHGGTIRIPESALAAHIETSSAPAPVIPGQMEISA
ncbi:helix-turn-helix domain-containing protein [Streptomyces sp. NPDC087787]|uniref:helix-turn-helix domain-containing protein n=1 Tax=Streptomyces sp. NPDC087787 TaxID=3365803 RepID=UPI003821184D